MHKHALGVELYTPIIVSGKPIVNVVALKVECSDKEAQIWACNALNQVNTNTGVYSFLVSDATGDPHSPHIIKIDLQNIKQISYI